MTGLPGDHHHAYLLVAIVIPKQTMAIRENARFEDHSAGDVL